MFFHAGTHYRFSPNRYLGPLGRRVELQSEAEDEARALIVAVKAGTYQAQPAAALETHGTPTASADPVQAPAPAPIETVRTFAQTWLQTDALRLKASTIRFYTDHLGNHVYPVLGDRPIGEIARRDVKLLIAALRGKKLAHKTMVGIVRTLSTILSAAVEDEQLAANPALRPGRHLRDPDAPAKAEIDPYTRDEVTLLVETARTHFPDWHPFLLCGVRTGLRLGELRALQWGDIDWRARFIAVGRNYVEGKLTTTKTGRARRVDLSLQLRGVLRLWRRQLAARWLALGQPRPDLLFPSSTGTPLDDSNIRKAIAAIVTKAEVRQRRSVVHVLRHTFASLLLQQGESLTYVKEQMGHASIQITADVYGHLVPGGNRQAVDRLDDVELAAGADRPESIAKHLQIVTGGRAKRSA